MLRNILYFHIVIRYFNKIQCFCFEEQRLKGKESIEMPILFFLDSEFEKDPKMKDVNAINL